MRAIDGCLETWELAENLGDPETVQDCRDFLSRRIQGWHDAPWDAIPAPGTRKKGEPVDDWLKRMLP